MKEEDPERPHREVPDDERQQGRADDPGAKADEQLIRPEALRRDRGCVRATPEERGVSERRQAGVPDEQVQRAREDREDAPEGPGERRRAAHPLGLDRGPPG